MPGVVGMVQSPELPGLGPAKNPYPQDEDRRGRGVGYGLTVPRSERSTIHGESETLGDPIRFGLRSMHGPDVPRRALLPFETPFEPAFEPPIRNIIRRLIRTGGASVMRPRAVGIPTDQRLRGAHLDAGRGCCLGRHRGPERRVPGLARGVLGRLAVALRHQRLDLRLSRRSLGPSSV